MTPFWRLNWVLVSNVPFFFESDVASGKLFLRMMLNWNQIVPKDVISHYLDYTTYIRLLLLSLWYV